MSNSEKYPANALEVLIVGGGPCGLATAISVMLAGHMATVLEASDNPNSSGAGVQSSPNGIRLLSRWGLYNILKPMATAPRLIQIHDPDGRLLIRREGYDDEILRRYGFPLWNFHRCDLQAVLQLRASDLGVKVHYSSRVTELDTIKPSIILENGKKYCGDLVIVADGTWSSLRTKILGRAFQPQPTGETAYRITISRASVDDKGLLEVMDIPQTRVWAGPGLYAVWNPVRGYEEFNLFLLLSDNFSQEYYNFSTIVEEIRKRLENTDLMLAAMLQAIHRANKWPVVQVPSALTCILSQGTCVLAGDNCHSVHPILAQSLSLGLEDAATLGSVLSHVTSSTQLTRATSLYERLRNSRNKKILDESKLYENRLRSASSNAKTQRDDESVGGSYHDNDCIFSEAQDWIWKYDAYEEAEKAYSSDPY